MKYATFYKAKTNYKIYKIFSMNSPIITIDGITKQITKIYAKPFQSDHGIPMKIESHKIESH